MKAFLISIGILLAICSSLVAEVETVQVRWNAFKCLEPCVASVHQNLASIRSVSNIEINPQAGIALMDWDPRIPFSYEPFRSAAGGVGIKFNEVRIRVKGTITHDVNDFYLISRGDGARFRLIGYIHTEPGRYTPRYNIHTHPLSQTAKEDLLHAERNDLLVLISGPLYLPSHWPRVLITEEIKFNPEERKVIQSR